MTAFDIELAAARTATGRSPSPAPSGPGASPAASAAPWPALASTAAEWLSRPRSRTAVVGAALLLTGGVVADNSVWTLPLVIVGAVMIVVAWIGHRLGGSVGLEWGEHGAELTVRARIRPAAETPPREIGAPKLPASTAEVIEGEAHTVEIDLDELKALIAAAELADSPQPPVVHALRVARHERAAS